MSQCRLLARVIGRSSRSFCNAQVTSLSVDDERVQELLKRVNQVDMDVVFAPRKEQLVPPRYRVMTRDQLNEAHKEAVKEAEKLLTMTPVLPEREPKGKTLNTDEELEEYLDNRMVFTDISSNKENREREVVVREPSGVLREATWEERDRMMEVYFPVRGRRMWLPHMLTEEGLIPVLEAGHYTGILDMVCLQCEPDSADYIRVHHTVYDRIEVEGAYQSLRSTRHYGGLVWYLIQREKVTGFVKDIVERQLWSEGEALIELYVLCHPQSSLASRRCIPGKYLEGFCRHFSLGNLSQLPSSESEEALAT